MLISQLQQLILTHILIPPPLLLILMIQPRRIDVPTIRVCIRNRIPRLIRAPIDKHNRSRHYERQACKPQVNRMSLDEPRALGRRVDVTADQARRVADGEEEPHDCGAHVQGAKIGAHPADGQRNVGRHAGDRHEDGEVLYAGRDVGDEDGVADDGEQGPEKDEGPAVHDAVCDEGRGHRRDEAEDVRRDGKQVCGGAGEFEVRNNGRGEQGEGV